MTPVRVSRGAGPVVLGLPHAGTELPPGVHAALNGRGRALADTDWHVDRLYDGLLAGATQVRATFHRYVIDANRPPDGASLYPGQNTTGLVPLTDFDGQGIWREAPDADEIAGRCVAYHAPYHEALSAELDRVRAAHGVAVLWDCHSIRSRIPYLFEGELPMLNLGTYRGAACAGAVERIAWERVRAAPYPAVLNGRFEGGWTTRHYGRPADGVHAVQMEIAQRAYLADETPPWRYAADKAAALREVLGDTLTALDRWARGLGENGEERP